MLPYWHCACVDLGSKADNTTTAAHYQNSNNGRETTVKKEEIVGEQKLAFDCRTCDSTGTESDWFWLEEDRLQQTPMEQRVLYDNVMDEEASLAARLEAAEISTFPSLCDCLTADSVNCCPLSSNDTTTATVTDRCKRQLMSSSPEPVMPATLIWSSEFFMGDCRVTSVPRTAQPVSAGLLRNAGLSQAIDSRTQPRVTSASMRSTVDASVQTQFNCNNVNTNSYGNNPGKTVASGRSLSDIEAAVERTRNNSNQQQRYEMRGGHAVEICSRVEFPDKITRDVSVTVEATHSNGCHRVIMLKGLTAKKRPDLGPKVKDCRLRMDQIVLTRPNTSTEDWQKSVTMSYDSDFQVGLSEDKNKAL